MGSMRERWKKQYGKIIVLSILSILFSLGIYAAFFGKIIYSNTTHSDTKGLYIRTSPMGTMWSSPGPTPLGPS